MASDSISISVTDRRNVSSVKSYPFIRYSKPNIELVGVENAILDNDTIIILPPEGVVKLKATSVVGLKEIRYTINGNEQVITLQGEREYILSLRISY